jgi:hypothetical protein
VRRKREHGEWHELQVAAAAIATCAAIWLLSELTDYDPPTPAPVPPQTVESERRDDAVRAVSRGLPRPVTPLHDGAGHPDASGRPEDAGKRQLSRPIVGQAWADLAMCESTNNPRAVNPAGYYGLYQFDLPTWASVGGTGNPVNASPAEQLRRAKMLHADRGWQPWPQCAASLGLLP